MQQYVAYVNQIPLLSAHIQCYMESQRFKDLRDDSKDLVLAAAHIEDAKSGR